MSTEFNVVYHLATLHHWRSVLTEQLPLLLSNQQIHSIHITIASAARSDGDAAAAFDLIKTLSSGTPHQAKIKPYFQTLNQFEHPAIKLVDQIATEERHPILYFHAKAVSYFPPKVRHEAHRRYLNRFIAQADHWADFLAASDFDVCGPLLYRDEASGDVVFAGNFWLAKSAYIKNLIPYSQFLYDNRNNPSPRHVAEIAVNRMRRMRAYATDHTSLTDKTFKSYFDAHIHSFLELTSADGNTLTPATLISNPGETPHQS
ncbi:MAG TPA: hypothetical protein VGN88_09425 [Phycisphaerae bacterium]|jgi:hypothetical protein